MDKKTMLLRILSGTVTIDEIVKNLPDQSLARIAGIDLQEISALPDEELYKLIGRQE